MSLARSLPICCAAAWVSPGQSSRTTTASGGHRRGSWLRPRPRILGRSRFRLAWTLSCRASRIRAGSGQSRQGWQGLRVSAGRLRRILRDKIILGLLENPYVREEPVEIKKVASEGVDLSRRLAAESVTLLKNENNLLPLSREVKKVAVIGPHAGSGQGTAPGPPSSARGPSRPSPSARGGEGRHPLGSIGNRARPASRARRRRCARGRPSRAVRRHCG